jgi:hypothetical protein
MVNASIRQIERFGNYPTFKDASNSEASLGYVQASPHGPVAQLGERLVCIQEVVGSNPVGSTSLPGVITEGL